MVVGGGGAVAGRPRRRRRRPKLSRTLKANQEAVRLHLFPFSLRDRASAWFHSLEVGSINSWDQMRQAFLAQFFPPSKTAKLRDQI